MSDVNWTPDTPSYRVEILTPAVATEYLKRNNHNRRKKQTQVDRIADAILRGEWVFNGEAISFDTKGTLVDGQNRLYALEEAGRRAQEQGLDEPKIEVLVIRGLSTAAQNTIDDVSKRSVADALTLAGINDAAHLGATLNLVRCWEIGETGLRNKTRYRLTPTQAVIMAEERDEIREAVKEAHRIRNRMSGVVPLSLVAACWWKFSQIDESDCRDFFTRLASGEGLFSGDPIYALRRILWNNHQKTQKMPSLVIHAWIVKAWNYYRLQQKVDSIVWRPSGETFPDPR